jgi:hypothetical protein
VFGVQICKSRIEVKYWTLNIK